MTHWARTLAETVKLREDAERALSELLPGGQVPGVAQLGDEKILAQNRSEQVAEPKPITWKDVVAMYDRLTPPAYRQSAPVNAVDISTEVREDEGMTNLSEAAKATLIDALGGKQAARNGSSRELREASLIGPNNGLTTRGRIVRERLVREAEDRAFG